MDQRHTDSMGKDQNPSYLVPHNLWDMCEVCYCWNLTRVSLVSSRNSEETLLAFISALTSLFMQIHWNKKLHLVQNYSGILRHQWNFSFVWNHFAHNQYSICFVRKWFFFSQIYHTQLIKYFHTLENSESIFSLHNLHHMQLILARIPLVLFFESEDIWTWFV